MPWTRVRMRVRVRVGEGEVEVEDAGEGEGVGEGEVHALDAAASSAASCVLISSSAFLRSSFSLKKASARIRHSSTYVLSYGDLPAGRDAWR